jgi:serine/threonine protein kinase
MLPVIDAVRYLHEMGIVHRDLKVLKVSLSQKTCFTIPTSLAPPSNCPTSVSAKSLPTRPCPHKWVLPATSLPKCSVEMATIIALTTGLSESYCISCCAATHPSRRTPTRCSTKRSNEANSNSPRKTGRISVREQKISCRGC